MCAVQAGGTGSLFKGVNEPMNVQNLSDLEKKHLPVIEAPDEVAAGQCFDVRVEVGKLLAHPNEHKHFIQFVDLYADDTFLARTDFTAVKTCPRTSFCVSLDGPVNELRAYEYCNMHGTWVYRKPIKVT
jgi:superoxide reductase